MTRSAAAATSTLLAIPLALGLLADARAATFTLDRDVVPAGEGIVFHITTELRSAAPTCCGTSWA